MHPSPQAPESPGHREPRPTGPPREGAAAAPPGRFGPALLPGHPPGTRFTPTARRRHPLRRAFRRNQLLRAGALATLLALCGVIILAIVRQQTGTEGFLVGLALAVLPVPLLVGTFVWIDRVAPQPYRNLVFVFAWGACAATLVAILANGYAQHVLARALTATPSQTDSWGAVFAAPFIEETSKGAAVLLLLLFRRRHFQGVVDGIVVAGITATGFAFTENILYLGTAFGDDRALGSSGLDSATLSTFFIRVVMSPFAHPLFTGMTGVGFGIAAAGRPGQARRWAAPLGGWLLAMTLHGVWNDSSSLGSFGFLVIYAAVMFPAFALLAWLTVWARCNELRTIRAHLPIYAAAGWLSPVEPLALSSMKARRLARELTRHARGCADARAVREYQCLATALAFLRARAVHGVPDPDFSRRERELLYRMWHGRALAQPVLTQAAHTLLPIPPGDGVRWRP